MFEFHVLTLGQFSRNKFWGELDTQSYREAICTSTLVKGKINIVIDPSLPPGDMAKVLYNRSGLRPEEIGFVFLTHAHGDHRVGIELFENARWLISETELKAMRNPKSGRVPELAGKLEPCETAELPEGFEFVSLPGHTPGTTGLLFPGADGRVCVCGDAAMTRDFFRHRQGYYNSVDFALASESIEKMAALADIIVPGHDNYFINKRN